MSAKKAIDTVSLVASALSVVKTLGVVFAMALLEWARLRQKRAEFDADAARNDLEVERVKHASKNEDPASVIRDFLDSDKVDS